MRDESDGNPFAATTDDEGIEELAVAFPSTRVPRPLLMTQGSLVAARFGRLWGKGHESFTPEWRRILRVSGKGATTYLQGLVTADLQSPPVPPRPEAEDAPVPGVPRQIQEAMREENRQVEFSDRLRSACFLDHKGRIVTDSLLWKIDENQYFIDCPGSTGDLLLQHLKQYKLRRSKVSIDDATEQMASHVIFGTLNAGQPPPGYVAGLDPRHPSLGMRVLKLPSDENPSLEEQHQQFSDMVSGTFPESPLNYELVRRLAGVAEGSELTGKIALESNQEFLNAVSFHKGCYLGQELTARVNYTGAIRKRIMPIFLSDTNMQVPQAWTVASHLQQGRQRRRFLREELVKLPTRLPRLSILTAGNMVSIMSGAVDPAQAATDEDAAMELDKLKAATAETMTRVEEACTVGSKLVDSKDGKTVGQIVSTPLPGTNVALALMRLESVGLMSGGVWMNTNKVKVGDSDKEFRYLPYLPLWWPRVSAENGKALADGEDGIVEDEVHQPGDDESSPSEGPGLRISFEEIDEKKS